LEGATEVFIAAVVSNLPATPTRLDQLRTAQSEDETLEIVSSTVNKDSQPRILKWKSETILFSEKYLKSTSDYCHVQVELLYLPACKRNFQKLS